MIVVLGTMRIAPGTLDDIQPAMAEMIAASRREDGCIAYSYALDVLDDGLIQVVEKWRDREALDSHFQTDHLHAWREKFGRLGISDRNLRLFAVDDGMPT